MHILIVLLNLNLATSVKVDGTIAADEGDYHVTIVDDAILNISAASRQQVSRYI
jgi:hypothetical protein